MITTTLAKIRKHRPCGLERGSNEGYDLLRKTLGKNYGDDTPIKFSQIVESNGLEDALWCLRSICPEHEKEVRLFAADCAERVLHLFEDKFPEDKRPREAIQAARYFAEGKITEESRAAAWDAARAAARAARAAARAAWDAARAAGAAARAVTRAAAGAAARTAAGEKIQTEMLIERFG